MLDCQCVVLLVRSANGVVKAFWEQVDMLCVCELGAYDSCALPLP